MEGILFRKFITGRSKDNLNKEGLSIVHRSSRVVGLRRNIRMRLIKEIWRGIRSAV
jgi:hypothetical protein